MMDLNTDNIAQDCIRIQGAREHNLKNISLQIPRNQFVVITGVSGSGKSTLAFDILFAEGQRRFLDAMNAYARQFVEQLPRPDIDSIQGLPPTVSIEQRNSRGGGKSTVATVTEVYHFLRLLYSRLGIIHCPECRCPVGVQTRQALTQQLVKESAKRGELNIFSPVIVARKGHYGHIASWASTQGFESLRVDGVVFKADQLDKLDRYKEHNIEVLAGTLTASRKSDPASTALVNRALELGNGILYAVDETGAQTIHSTREVCPSCGKSFPSIDPKMLSYNSPRGWCPQCRGFGELFYLPEADRGARAEAIEESWFEWQEGKREPCPECAGSRLNTLARSVYLDLGNLDSLFAKYGLASGPADRSRKSKKSKQHAGISLVEVNAINVKQGLEIFGHLRIAGERGEIVRDIIPEIRSRLQFLNEVGLGYLELGRAITTLSSGEAQRIRLAAQLGSHLSGVLYILDEPTIGLHARDNEQLLSTLRRLRSQSNSIIVVEHDEATMRQSDYIVDLGPGAGVLGGQVVAAGRLEDLRNSPQSLTGQCLKQIRQYPSHGFRRPVKTGSKAEPSQRITLKGVRKHNLKNLTVSFPLNRLIMVTGVSGSGKSTLVRDCLLPALHDTISQKRSSPPKNKQTDSTKECIIQGTAGLVAVYEVDQSPIGRTPRSIPSTYVGFFDEIRRLFSQVPESRMRGYLPGRFSFNSPQGRCPECLGAGTVKLEMNFLPTASIRCETCQGARFNPQTLDVRYHGKNIAEVLAMSVGEAREFFSSISLICKPLEALCDTGLDYLKLGQTSPTLSGGEAQRLKLVTHLLTGLKNSKSPAVAGTGKGLKSAFTAKRHAVFILEEPSIGLHAADVLKLVDILQRLVDAGNTVIVIEHHLDLIAEADWIIDMGPEAGIDGGQIVTQGTPEQVARNKNSHTGRFLRNLVLKNE